MRIARPRDPGFGTPSIWDISVTAITGETLTLDRYRHRVLLIVNVASKCGLTPQYEDLQAFYEQYKDKGVVVLGFPANNFMGQEPGTEEDIKSFCSKNYGVTFPMFSKISVKGNDMAPLYKFLTSKEQNGVMDAPVSWNFQKFLIDKEGRMVTFFEPKAKVTEEKFIAAVKALL